MTIYNHSGEELLNIGVTDESYRYRSIMQDNSVTLYYSLAEHVELPVGSYIEFQGERYTLWRPENFKKHGTRNFEYTVTFGGNQEVLKKYKFKLLSSVPYRLKFDLVAQPQMAIELLVDNLNLYDSGWSVGQCIEASEKALSFNHEYCYDVLNRLAEEFDTEWEIVGKTIHFCKVEKFKDVPLALSYGKGNGFKTGVGRSNEGDKQPVSVLYVQGGERNIDFSRYKSKTLLLPKSQTYTYEGRTYQTDKEGMYITRADKPLTDVSEDSYDASEIYPKRVGTISEVIAVNVENNFYDIKDKDIPADLDFSQYRIAGEKATIIFQSGILAGKEFDLEQTEDRLTGYIHAERRFKIVPQEIDGVIMPNETFKPAVDDTYAIFNISLPDAYICDNATQTGGSWEMFKEAVRYFYEREEPLFTFSGELDGIWAKRHWLEIGGKIQPGGYVNFSDMQFQPDGVLIRITGVKDYINKPHSPSLELSNLPVSGSIRNDLGKIEANEVVVEKKHNDALQFTKRRYRDAKETMQMLVESLLNFSDAINPIAIQTMQLLLGDKSLQFRFVDSKTAPSVVAWNIAYNGETKELTVPGVILQHMTLGITEVKPHHAVSDYRFWDLSAYGPMVFDEAAKKYYLYAKCSKDNQTGSFLPSERAIGMEQVSGYYHFLVGILNSEHEGDRSFAPLYGYTEILPGQITTDCIRSVDGNTYFDLARNEIGGRIVFTSSSGQTKTLPELEDSAAQDATNKANEAKQAAINDAARKYDSTVTTINGGLVTSGTIQLAGDGTGKAGITGQGTSDDSVRIWAGTPYANRTKAPFRVLQNGKMIGTDVELTGTINAEKGGCVGPFNITPDSLYTSHMNLSDQLIFFKNGTMSAGIGFNTAVDTLGLAVPLSIENTGGTNYPPPDTVIGGYFSAKGALDNKQNFAISIGNGCIDGFAIRIETRSSGIITNGVGYVIATASSLSLPSSPSIGAVIYIKHRAASRVDIHGNGHKIFANKLFDSIGLVDYGYLSIFVFDGGYWNFNYLGV